MIGLEGGNLDGLVFIILLIMIAPAILFFIIGTAVRKNNKKASKVLYILGVVYLIISFGTCGSMMI